MAHPAPWLKIDAPEAQIMMREALSGLCLTGLQGDIANLFLNRLQAVFPAIPTNPAITALTDDDEKVATNSLNHATLAALGLFAFVYPYERYKKRLLMYPTYNQEPAEAFGMNAYFDRAVFSHRFPRTVIHTWSPKPGAQPKWFADCIRNSFAHAQSEYLIEAGRVGVSIANSEDGRTPNFDITMDIEEFHTLIREALGSFIRTIVNGAELQPLHKVARW